MKDVPDTDLEEIDDGDVVWRFERSFLTSNWTCIWGRGCQGILPDRAEHLAQGCCSFGAEVDEDEAATIAALAIFLTPEQFQHHAAAAEGGVFADEGGFTRLVDGACIFLNRPGFPGGPGCALHRAALEDDVSPIDSKPSVCWQLPIRVDWDPGPADTEIATVRRWARADWGADGPAMAWVCTEEPDAYVGEEPVIDSLADELAAIVGDEVYVELRRRIAPTHDEAGDART